MLVFIKIQNRVRRLAMPRVVPGIKMVTNTKCVKIDFGGRLMGHVILAYSNDEDHLEQPEILGNGTRWGNWGRH